MGLRQLGDPLQGVRAGGRAPHPAGEDRRRGDGAPLHRGRPAGVAAHPVGQGRGLRRPGEVRGRPRRRDRRHQRQPVPGRRLPARQRRQPRRRGAPQGDRPPARMRRHHGRHRVPRPQAVVRRRHQLPGPGLPAGPPGPARRGAAGHLRPARRRPAAAAGVQVLRARLLLHRRAGLGHRRTRTASSSGRRRRW